MCCTLEEATLTSTYLLAHQVEHEGRMVNVLGYQNVADSKTYGPNAMIIPIPSATPMSQANCVDMTGASKVFRDYWDILRPRSRGVTLAAAAGEMDSLDVFESGSYTVVLSRDARLTEIREALHGLPSGKRMEVDVPKAKIFAAYKKLYPGWHIAICVWEGHVEAEPILWWYDPMPEYKDRHFLPGLDAHDGRPPDLGAEVRADHTLIIGVAADDHRAGNAGEVVQSAPTHLRKWLPDTVRGSQVEERLPNGDWVLPKDGWDWRNEIERIHLTPRVQPPGVAAA